MALGLLALGKPFLRLGVLIITGASFVFLIIATVQSHRNEEIFYSQLIRTTPWAAWQLEREYFRFREALRDYSEGVAEIDHEYLVMRFEILLSRIPHVLTGVEANLLRSFTGVVDFVPELEAELLDMEDAILTLNQGDNANTRHILGRLSTYGTPLQMLSARAVLGPEVGRLREKLASAQVHTQRLSFSLAIVAISLVALLVFELMISRQTMLRERCARLAARQMAEENGRMRQRLESITEAVGVALYSKHSTADRQAVEYASENFVDVARSSPDSYAASQGVLASAHLADRDRVAQALRRLSTHGRMSVEYRLDGGDTNVRWVSHLAVVIANEAGASETVGVIKDVTDERMAEAVMAQNAKLITLGELATGLAHEINQPLSVIRMAAQNMLRTIELAPEESHRDYIDQKLKRIVDQTKRASRIVEQMRIFGRAKSDEENVDFTVEDAVTTALDLIEQKLRLSSIEFICDMDENTSRIIGVQQNLEQTIINIVLNARDAIIERRQKYPEFTGEIRLTKRSDVFGANCTLEITDNAGGIREDVIDRLFHPFVTTKNVGKGTGLGLWIAFGFVTRMGGTISAANVEGRARFSIVLPTSTRAEGNAFVRTSAVPSSAIAPGATKDCL